MNQAQLFITEVTAALQNESVASSTSTPSLEELGINPTLLREIARSGALRREMLAILQQQNDQTARHLIRDHLFDATQQLETSSKKLRSNVGRKINALTGGGATLGIGGVVGLAAGTISGWIAVPMIVVAATIIATGFGLGDRSNDVASEQDEEASCYEELRKMLDY